MIFEGIDCVPLPCWRNKCHLAKTLIKPKY